MQRCFDIHLWISFTPNATVLFVDVAIQPEVLFIAQQNLLMKIGNNGNLVLGPFDESTPCLTIVLMNCQTKLRINHLPAVKSVAILESDQCMLNMSRLKRTPVGMMWKLGEEVPVQVSSPSLDRSSELRGPPPLVLVQLYSATLISPTV
ncbi:alpha-2 adrenergic receptor [Trichonephila clavipes]|nr:alpha-2 adrenergic receptor [Trichonephila clavipes]